jgi:hypothetical protein
MENNVKKKGSQEKFFKNDEIFQYLATGKGTIHCNV